MRLVSAVLFVALTGSWVAAEEAKPADPKPEVTKKKVPYRVVKMLPETGQVLLFDKKQGNHVVAEVGQALDGYVIDEIDEDEVTLIADSGAHVILTAPPPPPRMAKRLAKKTEAAPVDPYGVDEAKAADLLTSGAPVDPYADPEAPKAAGEGGVRVASAADPSTATMGSTPTTGTTGSTATTTTTPSLPPTPGVNTASAAGVEPQPSDPYGHPGIAAFVDAVGSDAPADPNAAPKADAKGSKAKPTKAKPGAKGATTTDDGSALGALAGGATATAPAGTPATGPAPTATIARAELDAALADFSKLAGSFKATFTAQGLRFDAINGGTLLAKAGLEKGDIVTAVDGQPLRSLDDAANLYARASTIKATTLQVTRAGKPLTLRIAIQ